MRSLFEKNLLRMKQELTDLKTATKRGLGTIRFYTMTAEATIERGKQTYITATFDEDGFFPGFAEIIGGPFYGIKPIDTDSLTWSGSATTGLPTPQSFTIQVVSTTPIKSLEVS